jgi:hypothetical protein
VDHEKSLVAVTKDLQLPSVCLHQSEAAHSNLASLRLRRKILLAR